MSWFKNLLAVVLMVLMAACGGGGNGSAGTSVFEGGTATAGDTAASSATTAAAAFLVDVSLQRAGVVTTAITSTESVQVVAKVTTKSGAPVSGVVVTFGQSAALAALSPVSATALTDSSGNAVIDLTAAAVGSTGATTVTASATINGTGYSGQASFSITAGAVATATPKAINFVSVNPADKAIVIKGAGGNGRSESATLTFKVVDASNAPIKDAIVNFSINPAGGVVLNISSAKSNAEGLVTTTVQSGALPASVVVIAVAAANPAATAPSDTLLVSNGSAVADAFEIVAQIYNLDGRTTGDKTTLSAYVADANGNPVADGVTVSFTTDAGAVASSVLGGCLTVNGACSVDFRVQEPRGTGIATVVASVNVGAATLLSDSLQINMSGATGGSYIAVDDPLSTTPIASIDLGASCAKTFELYLKDSDKGRAPAAGSTIASSAGSTGLTAVIKSGSPVQDQLAGFSPVKFAVEFSVSTTAGGASPICNPTGSTTAAGFINLVYTTPKGVRFEQRLVMTYPS